MRRPAAFRIAVTAVAAALVSGCTLGSIGVVDVYEDAYLLELQQTLEDSGLVSHTDLEPEFYERPQNIAPMVADVSLEPGVSIAMIAPLIAEATEVAIAHDEDVPSLEFHASDDTLTSLGFSGRLTAEEADAVVGHIVDGGWTAASIHVPGDDEPHVRLHASVPTTNDADALVEAANTPLPDPLEGALLHQWVQIGEPRFVQHISVSGTPISAEFMSAMAAIDALPGPAGDDLIEPKVQIGNSLVLSTDSYTMNARVSAYPEQYSGLDRDQKRELALDDGYVAFCSEVDRLVQGVPEMDLSGTDCRIGGLPVEY